MIPCDHPSLTIHLFFQLRQARHFSVLADVQLRWCWTSWAQPTGHMCPLWVPSCACIYLIYLTCLLGSLLPAPIPQPGLQPAYPHDAPFLPLSLCQYYLSSSSFCPSTFLGQKHTHSLNATISNTPSSLKHLLPVPKCKWRPSHGTWSPVPLSSQEACPPETLGALPWPDGGFTRIS